MRTIVSLCIACLLVSPALAQPGQPAKELAKFDKVLGHWVGQGESWMSPDQPPAKWTSKSTTTKVLGGHFIRDVTRVDFGPPMGGTLAMVTYYGWDAEEKRYVTYGFSNLGQAETSELTWLDDTTTVSYKTSWWEGSPGVERWTTKVHGDEATYEGHMATGNGPFFTHVKGSAKRVKDAEPVSLEGIGPWMVQQTKQMKRLARMTGKYKIAGGYRMLPSQPFTEFEGTEKIKSIFGGTIVLSRVAGDGYEGVGAMAWDDRRKRYSTFHISNWGMGHAEDGWFTDDTHFVATSHGTMMGTPMVGRTTVVCDDEGRPVKASAHAIMGTSAPYESFKGTYSPVKEPAKGTGGSR